MRVLTKCGPTTLARKRAQPGRIVKTTGELHAARTTSPERIASILTERDAHSPQKAEPDDARLPGRRPRLCATQCLEPHARFGDLRLQIRVGVLPVFNEARVM